MDKYVHEICFLDDDNFVTCEWELGDHKYKRIGEYEWEKVGKVFEREGWTGSQRAQLSEGYLYIKCERRPLGLIRISPNGKQEVV